jgi:hypothetical protein
MMQFLVGIVLPNRDLARHRWIKGTLVTFFFWVVFQRWVWFLASIPEPAKMLMTALMGPFVFAIQHLRLDFLSVRIPLHSQLLQRLVSRGISEWTMTSNRL